MDLDDDVPLPGVAKRYSHYGKTQRKDNGLLLRCPIVDQISRSTLVCNHLLWRNRPDQLREHLTEHKPVPDVAAMSDEQILDCFVPAKRIFLERCPEDEDEDEDQDAEIDEDPDQEP